jgi:hypothetical protein
MVCAKNLNKTKVKTFFLQGHLLALENFCRSLSEVLDGEKRDERPRGRGYEVQSSEFRGNRELPEFMEGIHGTYIEP